MNESINTWIKCLFFITKTYFATYKLLINKFFSLVKEAVLRLFLTAEKLTRTNVILKNLLHRVCGTKTEEATTLKTSGNNKQIFGNQNLCKTS